MRMRNEVCIFFSVDTDENKIYWKYISDDYIRQFQKKGYNAIHTYEFCNDEIVTSENVAATINSGICLKCGGHLIERNGKYGTFYGCSNYPKCRFTTQ